MIWGTMHADVPFERVSHPGIEPWERTYATFIHLTLLICPVAPVVGALVMWLIRKDESAYVDDHGREAINFQISLVIYMIVLSILAIPIGVLTCGVGLVLPLGVYVLGIVGMILAATAANKGEYFRYPMCLRFIG